MKDERTERVRKVMAADPKRFDDVVERQHTTIELRLGNREKSSNGHMASKLVVGCGNLFKGCAVAQEGLLMQFYELGDYLNRSNTCLQTYCDSGLPCNRGYVYSGKVNKEIGHRS